MDLFCEFLVKKKSLSDKLKRTLLIFACIIFCIAIFFLSFLKFHSLIFMMPLLIAAAIYGTVIYGRNFSIEYEYVFTNGVLDVDVIKGRITRAPLVSVPCRKIEYMGPLPQNYQTKNEVFNAIYDEKRPGKYVVTFIKNGKKADLLFQPPEKLLQNMKKYNPRNIHLS